jgi:hypothetical protein
VKLEGVHKMSLDYKVIDMPSTMSTEVKMLSSGSDKLWVRDDGWYDQVRDIYSNLIKFLAEKNLVTSNIDLSLVDEAVIMFSDLTEVGQALVLSGATDNWLGSFDRPGTNKSPSNIDSLVRALKKLEAGNRPSQTARTGGRGVR